MTAPTDDRRLSRSVLEEEREFFLRSLRDLEAERAAGDIDDVDYRSLRDDYTIRAAEVVRQLAVLDEPVVAPPASAAVAVVAGGAAAGMGGGEVSADDPGPAGGHRGAAGRGGRRRVAAPRRRVLIGVAVMIVAAGVAFAVLGLSRPSMNSTARVQTLDEAAQNALGSGQSVRALQDYQAALKISPTDYLTLTGEGEMLVELGGAGHNSSLLALGLSRLRSAEIANPAYGPAFGARGIGFFDEGDYAAAVPEFETYLADTPPATRSTSIERALATAKRKLATKGS